MHRGTSRYDRADDRCPVGFCKPRKIIDTLRVLMKYPKWQDSYSFGKGCLTEGFKTLISKAVEIQGQVR